MSSASDIQNRLITGLRGKSPESIVAIVSRPLSPLGSSFVDFLSDGTPMLTVECLPSGDFEVATLEDEPFGGGTFEKARTVDEAVDLIMVHLDGLTTIRS